MMAFTDEDKQFINISPCCRNKRQSSSPRDVATQFAGFESGGLQCLEYPSREDISEREVHIPQEKNTNLWQKILTPSTLPFSCEIVRDKIRTNYENPSIFAKVTAKKSVALFYADTVYIPVIPKSLTLYYNI